MLGGQFISCGSSTLRDGSWQGLSVFGGKEERAMHSSSAVFYHPGQPADPGGLPNQHSKLSFAAISTAESRSWGWVNPNIRIAWILAGNVPPYPGGCLCVIFMLVRKLIIPFTRLSEPGGLPLNTWSSSWGWCGGCVCVSTSVCMPAY